MEYTPSTTDIIFAKGIYDSVIMTQTLKPLEIKEAFKRLFGYDAYTSQQAKIKVACWFQYTFQPEMLLAKSASSFEIDSTETAEINQPSVAMDNQSHSEDLSQEFISDVRDSQWLEKPKRKRIKKEK